MKLKHILLMAAAALLVWFMYDALSQPSPTDLPGDFKEVAMYRNENNTGPVIRVYAVSVADTLWQQMQVHGSMMPHTKYGNTKIYYFLNTKPLPNKVYPGAQSFAEEFQEFAVAKYEKDAMGQVSFVRFPYR